MLIPTRTQRLAQKKTTTETPRHPTTKYPPQPPSSTIRLSVNEWKVLTGQSTYLVVRQPKSIAYCCKCGTYSDAFNAASFHLHCGPNALNRFEPRPEFFDARQPLLNPVNHEIIWLLKPGMREKMGAAISTPESQSHPP